MNIGANGNPVMTDLATSCLGNEQLYYPGSTRRPVASPISSTTVTLPLYADDIEENDGDLTTDTVAASLDHDGFGSTSTYDDNTDYFPIDPANGWGAGTSR